MLAADLKNSPAPELRPEEPGWRQGLYWRGVAHFGVGAALVVLGLAPLALPGAVRTLMIVCGIYLLLRYGCDVVERRTGRRLDLGLLLSAAWLVLLTLAAIMANVLPLAEGRDPSNALTSTAMLPPDVFSGHPLGTDSQALDVLAQLLFGARVSLVVATGAVIIALIVGGALGVFAGYFRGKIEAIIGFVTDTMLAFPALILLLALVTVLKPTVLNVTLALGVLGTPGTIRLARAATLSVASREFVTASRTLGARTPRIVLGEVVPNVLPPLIAYSFVAVGFLLVAEASLSFLGLGIQRPNPTWGNLIAQGQSTLGTQPWLVILPSTFLFLTVVAANYIGQRLQQKWNLS